MNSKKQIIINESVIRNIVSESLKNIIKENSEDETKVGDWIRKRLGKGKETSTDDGTHTDYSSINQRNNPFSTNNNTYYSDDELASQQQAVDKANQRSETFNAREQVKDLINSRKYYIGCANRVYGQAKKMCKQYGFDIGEIMKEMGISNSATRKYDASVDANNMALAMGTDDAIEESKKHKIRKVRR